MFQAQFQLSCIQEMLVFPFPTTDILMPFLLYLRFAVYLWLYMMNAPKTIMITVHEQEKRRWICIRVTN